MFRRWNPIPLVMALAAIGCSDDLESSMLAAYPGGPYGDENPRRGEVVENLRLRGLFAVTAEDAIDEDVNTFFLQDYRETGATHLLLTVATAWCPSCQAATQQFGQGLQDDVEAITDAGGLVAQLLLEGPEFGTAATDQDVVDWAEANELQISVFRPRDDRGVEVFPERDFAYIIELDTMEIRFREQHLFPEDDEPTSSEAGIDALRDILGL